MNRQLQRFDLRRHLIQTRTDDDQQHHASNSECNVSVLHSDNFE